MRYFVENVSKVTIRGILSTAIQYYTRIVRYRYQYAYNMVPIRARYDTVRYGTGRYCTVPVLYHTNLLLEVLKEIIYSCFYRSIG